MISRLFSLLCKFLMAKAQCVVCSVAGQDDIDMQETTAADTVDSEEGG
jgi:hypothetical protein